MSRTSLLRAAMLAVAAMGVTPAIAAGPSEHTMHVYKTPWCGCCGSWTDYMKSLGYRVEVTELDDLTSLRRQAAVPDEVRGCHITAVDGYVLEGHVPPEAIAKLLDERPDVHGIAVPGMPRGSIGMGDDPKARYDVVTFGAGTAQNSSIFYQAGPLT